MFLVSKLRVIHDCSLDEAEEESIWLDMCFTSQLTEAMFRVPLFAHYIETVDSKPMYVFLKTMLQAAQFLRNDRRPWVLKSPNHLEWLSALLEIFPDARIVHAQRPLSACLFSTISASCHAYRLFSQDVDVKEVRQHWLTKFKYVATKCLQMRSLSPAICTEIPYSEIAAGAKPLTNTLERALKISFSPEVHETAQKPFQSQHHYRPADLYLQENVLDSIHFTLL